MDSHPMLNRISRPDHILMSPALYESAKPFGMLDDFASDLCGLSMVFGGGGSTEAEIWKLKGTAASNRAVGMTSLAKRAFVPARKQEGLLSPVWFDEQSMHANVKAGKCEV
eukprot:scaffold2674_cov21-Tisochrysis_lutea.AAC.1